MTFRVQFTINWLCLVKSTFVKIRFYQSILVKGCIVYASTSADLINDVEALSKFEQTFGVIFLSFNLQKFSDIVYAYHKRQ
jgi:hypothetical protein